MKNITHEITNSLNNKIAENYKFIFPRTKEVKESNIKKIINMSSTLKKDLLIPIAEQMVQELKTIYIYKNFKDFNFYVGLEDTGFRATAKLIKSGGIEIFQSVSHSMSSKPGIYMLPEQFKTLSKLYIENLPAIKSKIKQENQLNLKRIEREKNSQKKAQEVKKLEQEKLAEKQKLFNDFNDLLKENNIEIGLLIFAKQKYFSKKKNIEFKVKNIYKFISDKTKLIEKCFQERDNYLKITRVAKLQDTFNNIEEIKNIKQQYKNIKVLQKIQEIIKEYNVPSFNLHTNNKRYKKNTSSKKIIEIINSTFQSCAQKTISEYTKNTPIEKDAGFSSNIVKVFKSNINNILYPEAISFKYMYSNSDFLFDKINSYQIVTNADDYMSQEDRKIQNKIKKEIDSTILDLKKEYYAALKNTDKNLIKDIAKKIESELIKLDDISRDNSLLKLVKDDELKAKATITNIENFYYKARMKKRNFKAYVGPTNSGKTHKAIKIFKEAKTGIYLAPLRLLAREIFEDLKNELKISLITGEEKEMKVGDTHVSSTIEMLNINREYEVAVIDEVQMIEDNQRGAAWSKAILGVNAKTVIVIGSDNSVTILDKIVTKCGDSLEIEKFNRLVPLEKENAFLNYSDIQPGDAVICFSRANIYRLKTIIERLGLSVAVVYGALPPETRLNQVEAFNNKKADVIVATDAIGMGLNLNIKRVVFSSIMKYNGQTNNPLDDSLFKQIAGRAGRYNQYDNGKFAFLLDYDNYYFNDYEKRIYDEIAEDIHKPLNQIEEGVYFPEIEHLKEFTYIKTFNNRLSDIIEDYYKYYKDDTNTFAIKNNEQFNENAYIIDRNYKDMSLEEKYKYAFAPTNNFNVDIFSDFILNLKKNNNIELPSEIKYIFENIDNLSLSDLESSNKNLMLYVWLLYRHNEHNTNILKLRILKDKVSSKITNMISANSSKKVKINIQSNRDNRYNMKTRS